MRSIHPPRPLAMTVALSFLASTVWAQAVPTKELFEPDVGQEGKDVIWVPTDHAMVKKMLDMAKVTSKDYVIDLGSGDGRTVIAAAKRGARALGIEYNPDMVELSRRLADKEGVSDKAKFVNADLFESDFSQATVITMFLLTEINLKLRPKILDMKPGTRVVSNSFDMGDWMADENSEETEDCSTYCEAFLWIVPAKVTGTWQLSRGELLLKQTFQTVSGTLKSGRKGMPITHGKLRGDQLTFRAGGTQYTGRVQAEMIQGEAKRGEQSEKWSARKILAQRKPADD